MVGTQQCIPGSNTHVYSPFPYPGSSYRRCNNDNVHNVLCLSSAVFITLMLAMHLRKTELKIPTDRRQTSWLFTSVTDTLNSGLSRTNLACVQTFPPPPLRRFPIFPEGKVGGGGSVYRLEQIQPALRAGLELRASEFKRTNLSATVLPSLLFRANACASVHS